MLTEKYRPHTITEFIGLKKAKAIFTRFASEPQEDAFYCYGPSGTGKTTMALAVAEQIRAHVLTVPSQRCNVQTM